MAAELLPVPSFVPGEPERRAQREAEALQPTFSPLDPWFSHSPDRLGLNANRPSATTEGRQEGSPHGRWLWLGWSRPKGNAPESSP